MNRSDSALTAIAALPGPASPVPRLRDLVSLGKPRVTLLVLLTTAVGLSVAPGTVPPWTAASFLLGTACLVASANTLNCWLERDTDASMRRTRQRPLPAGRLAPGTALAWGTLLGAAGLAALAATTNPTTTVLGAIALLSYVAVYTPLKRLRWWALIVGAVPGAIPPLMGWSAATGAAGAPGWALFAILFFWQLPHFIAISIYLQDDYRRGGLRVLPLVHGERAARRHAFAYTVLLVAASLCVVPLGLAGPVYLLTAVALGLGFLGIAARGLAGVVESLWARRAFLYSIVYLSALIGALVLDARA